MDAWGAMTESRFVAEALPGRIVHAHRPGSWVARWIRACLDKWERRLCAEYRLDFAGNRVRGSHDGLILDDPETGERCVGESLALKGATLTPLTEYMEDIRNGTLEVWLLEPVDATEDDRLDAANAWLNYVRGTPYDYAAYPRLAIKALLADRLPKAAGWEWANWCTEGVALAWGHMPPGMDVWQTRNPTPLTTEQVAGWVPRKPGKRVTLRTI